VKLLLLSLALLAAQGPRAGAACDLLFTGGRVVDGTGAPWFRADVCVTGDRITAVGDLGRVATRRSIDASSLVIAPGFIDMLGQSEYYLLVDNRAASKITQGITTEITGEGSSLAPLNARMIADDKATWERYGVTPDWTDLEGYFRALERARPAINLGTFVGAGGLRNLVIGQEDRRATPQELLAMQAEVEKAMRQGAFGLSTSLQYVPDRFADTEEIVALARSAARHGGSYITHQRSESGRIDESLDEVFRIAREARIPAQVYHLKTAYKKNWGRMPAVLGKIERARAEGLDVSANQYPYIAGSNGVDACLPLWVREGGKDKLVERLQDKTLRARIKQELLADDGSWENQYLGSGGPAGVLVASVLNPELKKYEGMTIAQIAEAQSKSPEDALMDLVIADRGNSSGIIFIMNEDDVRAAMRNPLVSFCTDSGAVAQDGILSKQRSHPRAWGSAARVLGKYVREDKVLTLEEAVRKMTSLPASRMGLADRGIVRPGMLADLVAFDPERVIDRATFEKPLAYSAGIPYVAVNGQLVVDAGTITAARPGRALRGPGYKPVR
jgi:dihydroorotase/N-acyl-D-amino-acid deacylase